MEEKRIVDILQRVADQNGVPLAAVLEEIDRVIDNGMESPNPQIRVQWERIPRKGAKPNAAELMTYLVDRAIRESHLPFDFVFYSSIFVIIGLPSLSSRGVRPPE